VTTAVFGALQNSVTGAVNTGGLYRNVNVIDIGNTNNMPEQYREALVGVVYFRRGFRSLLPGPNRPRTSVQPANLGAEMLWNSGLAPIAAPANSPAAFLVANNKYIWRAPVGTCPIASGEPANDASIALIIRFGQFFFYTGGDLPTVGEDLVGNAVFAHGLPDPQGGGAAFPLPARIAAFKLGHHGSDGSTSNAFLNQINARAGLISCGFNGFGTGDKHPTQAVINRLQASAGIDPFYLTNCNYVTTHIPASNGQDQLAAMNSRSRVCGDNASPNVAPGRHRGNCRLYLNQAESTAGPGVGRSFHVDYWDQDDNPFAPAVGGAQPPIGPMTEDQQY